MKISLVLVLLFFASLAAAQQPSAEPNPSTLVGPVPDVFPPGSLRGYSVLLVPADPKQPAVALMKSPAGQLVTISVVHVKEFFEAGYRPIIAGDLVEEEESLTSKLKDVSDKYDTCYEGFNDLVSRIGRPQQYTPLPPQSTSQDKVTSYLLLRSLLLPPTQNVNMRYTNCNKSPALCVH